MGPKSNRIDGAVISSLLLHMYSEQFIHSIAAHNEHLLYVPLRSFLAMLCVLSIRSINRIVFVPPQKTAGARSQG